MKKSLIRMVVSILTAIQILVIDVNAISAEKAILMDAQTGRVIYEKNADEKALIASTTKIIYLVCVKSLVNCIKVFFDVKIISPLK